MKRTWLLAFSVVWSSAAVLSICLVGIPSVSGAACESITQTLSLGSTDQTSDGQVSILQRFLSAQGFLNLSTPTGLFGDATQAAVKSFQSRYSIVEFGLVGVATRAKINALLCLSAPAPSAPSTAPKPAVTTVVSSSASVPVSGNTVALSEAPGHPVVSCTLPQLDPGAENSSVFLLQTILNKEGVYPENRITGYFGPLTKAAVIRFQQKNSLALVGRVGPKTSALLNQSIERTFPACASGALPMSPALTPVMLTSPALGSRWERGSWKDITWSSSTTSSMTLELVFCGAALSLCNLNTSTHYIVSTVPNTGTYSWIVGRTGNVSLLPLGVYILRLLDPSGTSRSATAFALVDTSAPTITAQDSSAQFSDTNNILSNAGGAAAVSVNNTTVNTNTTSTTTTTTNTNNNPTNPTSTTTTTTTPPPPTNHPPVFQSFSGLTVTEGQTLQFSPAASDADSDTLTFSASNLPSGASFSSATRTFSWTPDFGQSGSYAVNFSVSDGHVLVSQPATIVVADSGGTIPWKNSASYDYAHPRISFSPRFNWMIFKQNEPPTLTTSDSSTITIYDVTGRQAYSGPAGTLPLLSPGHYFVESATDRSEFLILPSDYRTSTFLGFTGAAFATGWTFPKDVATLAKMQWARVSVTWLDAETSAGTFDWTIADARMQANADRDMILLLTGEYAPSWAQGSQVADRFAEFVTAVLNRYRTLYPGRIKGIEFTNEPYCCGYDGTPTFSQYPYSQIATAYTAFIQKAYQALKAIDPSIMAVAPSFQGAIIPDLRNLSAAGAGQYIDMVMWHDYWLGYGWPDEGQPNYDFDSPRTDQVIEKIKQLFPGKLLGVDEVGMTGLSALGVPYAPYSSGCGENVANDGRGLWRSDTWYAGMNKLVKFVVMEKGGGLGVLIPHIFNAYNPDCAWAGWEGASGLDSPIGIKPQTSAFLMTGQWLEGASFVQESVLNGAQTFLYAFNRQNGDALVVAWATHGHTFGLQQVANASAANVFGTTYTPVKLTEEPIFFTSQSMSASNLLSAVASALAP